MMLDGVEVRRQVLLDCVIEAQLMCCVRRNVWAWPERRTDITSPAEDTPIGAMRHWTIARIFIYMCRVYVANNKLSCTQIKRRSREDFNTTFAMRPPAGRV